MNALKVFLGTMILAATPALADCSILDEPRVGIMTRGELVYEIEDCFALVSDIGGEYAFPCDDAPGYAGGDRVRVWAEVYRGMDVCMAGQPLLLHRIETSE